ncbi:unnamed protein product, partial [Discosporangium mesarthrocarpum]
EEVGSGALGGSQSGGEEQCTVPPYQQIQNGVHAERFSGPPGEVKGGLRSTMTQGLSATSGDSEGALLEWIQRLGVLDALLGDGMRVSSLYCLREYLQDGTLLCMLVERVTGRQVRGWLRRPKTPSSCLSNISKAFCGLRDWGKMRGRSLSPTQERCATAGDWIALVHLLSDIRHAHPGDGHPGGGGSSLNPPVLGAHLFESYGAPQEEMFLTNPSPAPALGLGPRLGLGLRQGWGELAPSDRPEEDLLPVGFSGLASEGAGMMDTESCAMAGAPKGVNLVSTESLLPRQAAEGLGTGTGLSQEHEQQGLGMKRAQGQEQGGGQGQGDGVGGVLSPKQQEAPQKTSETRGQLDSATHRSRFRVRGRQKPHLGLHHPSSMPLEGNEGAGMIGGAEKIARVRVGDRKGNKDQGEGEDADKNNKEKGPGVKVRFTVKNKEDEDIKARARVGVKEEEERERAGHVLKPQHKQEGCGNYHYHYHHPREKLQSQSPLCLLPNHYHTEILGPSPSPSPRPCPSPALNTSTPNALALSVVLGPPPDHDPFHRPPEADIFCPIPNPSPSPNPNTYPIPTPTPTPTADPKH